MVTKTSSIEDNLSLPEDASNCPMGSSLVKASSLEQHEVLQSAVELRVSFLKSFVENLTKSGRCIEKIAEILFVSECRLSDVICLQNVKLTRAFLQAQDSMSTEDFNKENSPINGDFLISINRVMSFLDVHHTEVVLTYGPNKNIKICHFFSNLVSMSTQQRDLEALKLFLKQIAKWNILDKETSMLIEQEVFLKADKEVIKIFLQSGLHNHINELFGSDILVALFGNPKVKIGYLKRKKLNVYTRGFNNSTALHYATKSKLFKRIKYLLDRGAQPNLKTSKFVTALNLALCEPNANAVVENEKCAELLLQYGADPFMLCDRWVFSKFCLYAEWWTQSRPTYTAIRHLSKLALAYILMFETENISSQFFDRVSYCSSLSFLLRCPAPQLKNYGFCLLLFSRRCRQELQMLKELKIRENLTMFTILLETGRKLFRLLNVEDCKIITNFIGVLSREKTLNPYYLNALREHMRQLRKLMSHKNRAMSVISASTQILTPFIVLDKIVSYLSYEDLLMFQ